MVSTTFDHKKRRIFAGNLIEQRRNLQEWLESEDVNPAIKLKGKRLHSDQVAYSDRALTEVLMNMLVHRDYSTGDLASINVTSKQCIEFQNPGGPSDEANNRLDFDADGKFDPVPEFSELRNRALCDVFFGTNAMERAGTGLADAIELSHNNGGAATFAFPPDRDCFVATLYRPEASAGSASIARSSVPVGTYVVNLLPFAAVPEYMQRAYIPGGWRSLEKHAQLDEIGLFVVENKSDTLLSFTPAPLLSLLLGGSLEGEVEEIPVADCSEDIILQRYVSWLLRKHFERYLHGFEDDGLMLELDKRGRPAKRAYFTGVDGEDRKLVYDFSKTERDSPWRCQKERRQALHLV